MPAHGRALWDGTANLPPHSEARSLLTGDKLAPHVTIGSVILPDAHSNALTPGKTGMVVSIDYDPEDGEAIYTLLQTRQVRNKTEAWTFTMRASEVRPEWVVPDVTNARHSYAIGCLRAAADKRWITADGMRLIDLARTLTKDCLWGGSK